MKTYKIIIQAGTTRETYYEPQRLSAKAREALDGQGWSYTQRLVDPEKEKKHISAARSRMEQAAAGCQGASSMSSFFSLGAGMAQEALKKLETAITGKMNLEGE
jgi:hypothetical protein